MTAKIRVLVADDVKATRDNIRKLVEFHPEITVIADAGSADEAMAKVKSLQPDVVLMDINMPGMDGISATHLITNEVPGTQP